VIKIKNNFINEVANGNIYGYKVIDIFGFNSLISESESADVWEGGGKYVYDVYGTAPIESLVSNDNTDNVPIKITGLNIEGIEVEQIVNLNGSTRVSLNIPLWRIFKMENDGASDLKGCVFCYTGTGNVPNIGDNTIRCIIKGNNNKSLMGIYTIPKGKTGYLVKGEFGIEFTGNVGAGTNYATCHYESRRINKTFKVKKKISLITLGCSLYTDKRSFPDPIPELTDIKLVVDEVSENIGIWGAFDILLKDNNL